MGEENSKPTFTEKYPELEGRKAKSNKLIMSHPNEIPVICEPVPGPLHTLEGSAILLISNEIDVG